MSHRAPQLYWVLPASHIDIHFFLRTLNNQPPNRPVSVTPKNWAEISEKKVWHLDRQRSTLDVRMQSLWRKGGKEGAEMKQVVEIEKMCNNF